MVLPECNKCLRLRASNCPIGRILFILFYYFFTVCYVSCGVVVGMNALAVMFTFWVLADEGGTLAVSLLPAP